MLNMQTPETTEVERWIVTRTDENGGGDWILVADTKPGSESNRCWQQVDEAVKDRHYRICHFASKAEAEQSVADCIVRWGLDFVKTPPRASVLVQTIHHEYRTFDVVDLLGS